MLARALAVLLLLVALAGCAAVEREGPPAALDAQRETAAIRAVLAAQQDAWNRGDVDGYMAAGYWQSPELVFLSGGSVTRGYEPVLARYRANYQADGAEMGQLEFRETEIELLSPLIALARGRWDLAMKSSSVGGRYSLVLRKFEVGWRIVQDHSSADTKAN
jgi:beta-aspartyl-peptidase (threonine type)